MKIAKLSVSAIILALAVVFMAPVMTLAQTVVATVSGGSATLSVSQSTLAAAMQQELNDGTSIVPATVAVEWWSSVSQWRLVGEGVNGSTQKSISVLLDASGSDLFITASSGTGALKLCSIIGCIAWPCSKENCNESCSSPTGPVCVSSQQPLILASHLGNFY